jgi:CDP-diacylglycerol--glycerol-3-phosphate 3-phosphatidyltransferase
MGGMTFTLANIVTISRLFLAPVFLVCILIDSPTAVTWSVVIYVVAALTDWLDGFLARRYGEVTPHGVFLDPLADKVLTTSAFIALVVHDIIPIWMVVVIIVRDFGVTAMRSIADDRGMMMQTSYAAKVKTFAQMVVIAWALVVFWLHKHDPASPTYVYLLSSNVTGVAMLAVTLLTIYTAVHYVFVNRRIFSRG